MAPRQKHGTSVVAGSVSHSGNNSNQARHTQLDFNALNIQALRKYRQAFKLNVKARSSKDELVLAASRHFNSHTVDEVDTIARFLYTVHSNKEKYPSVGY
ncbi:hypothetical protein COEREDRAFT_83288 [Coemansia reversa NRRL 1564]|uniref:Histone deacetylase complex subunit SAP30 Sin3 binding domain-containing protein n=1 Tax=Coemansia reversa (strain ATCC 12441 / NRRL 1564) TaxID=763665 RepID=A0A2G5B3U9_COERN|nr:hypothetical protein COEREDRAFT_83288 [Coemansia reversa NRRL 1564]|eukprot:PIA13688.1 hypothetical protein COEREDRAFT_83288 [Coemansia reversa NRRL 1564]